MFKYEFLGFLTLSCKPKPERGVIDERKLYGPSSAVLCDSTRKQDPLQWSNLAARYLYEIAYVALEINVLEYLKFRRQE